ncbi:MAG: endonuclease/exonuclease/phosphatase family protein [Nitrospira sp.]|nr:endonuclease/exonuclease/phosphatase family protein [Nitrospira sp.]
MASLSMKGIISALDPIADWQPRTIGDIARRLRWQQHIPNNLEEPQRPISLRAVGHRVMGPQTVQLRFLSYNTYLLPGFDIPLGRWLDDTIGWDALAWFGIPFGGGLLAPLGIASIPGLTLGSMLKVAGWTPSKVIKKIPGKDLNDVFRIKGKPTLDQRASAIGQHLVGANIYDVCCFSEVWMEDARHRVVDALDGSWQHKVGPDESGEWTSLGAGLLFLNRKGSVVKHENLIYSNRGSRQRDSDAWANKGIMLNVLQLPIGQLEVFQTHLYYGDGMPIFDKPTKDEQLSVWRAELRELADFYRAHHNPRNVAIITGDFNMNGADTNGQFAEISREMTEINFRDIWCYSAYRHGSGLTCRYTDGEDKDNEQNFDKQCGAPLAVQDSNSPLITTYCWNDGDQVAPSNDGVGRLDYIWVENPTQQHTYNLEVSRVLRRPFPFHTSGKDEEQEYLSDHMGLDCTLFLTPR